MSTSDMQEKKLMPEKLMDALSSKGETKASGEAEGSKSGYYEQITRQGRALMRAREDGFRTGTHEDFGTPTISGDDGKPMIHGGRPSKATLTAQHIHQLVKEQLAGSGSAEQAGRVIDYKPVQHSKSSFSLGMDYEEKPLDRRTPLDKLGNFAQAAEKRVADPEGWKAWAQGEIKKFAGIGAGLNEAKDETKTAAAAGWKALTDGTVVEFLSQPNAINAPVFKIVTNTYDVMSKDPNTINHAFQALGNVVMNASASYRNLPDYGKGKAIGKAMFFMVNPEGSTEGAEAAFKVADQVATHVDKAVLNTIGQTVESMKDMAPDVAQNCKQMLYDYMKRKGLTASQLERGGQIPEGFFDNLEKPSDAAAPVGKGGDWMVLNERPSPDVVMQLRPDSCVAACGEMLSNGALKQESIIEAVSTTPEALAPLLGPEWKGGFIRGEREKILDLLLSGKQSWGAELRDEFYHDVRMGHMVVVDGLNEAGNIMIRDPQDATRYEMTKQAFLHHWSNRMLFPSRK